MIDENINSRPYKVGDKLILEIEVTDENKSFDFLGKALFNKLDTSEFGFKVDTVCFWKDRYIDNIPSNLRADIIKSLQKSLNEITNILGIK